MRWKMVIATLLIVGLGASPKVPLAQSSASYSIPRSSVDAGAARSASASYLLRGTIGQPDATQAQSAAYALSGGFHRRLATAPQVDAVFANGFE